MGENLQSCGYQVYIFLNLILLLLFKQLVVKMDGRWIDRLCTRKLKWKTSDDVNERIGQGCLITGLFLEGAQWDMENQCLVKQPPKQLLQELPVLKVIPIEAHKLKLHGTLETPVY